MPVLRLPVLRLPVLRLPVLRLPVLRLPVLGLPGLRLPGPGLPAIGRARRTVLCLDRLSARLGLAGLVGAIVNSARQRPAVGLLPGAVGVRLLRRVLLRSGRSARLRLARRGRAVIGQTALRLAHLRRRSALPRLRERSPLRPARLLLARPRRDLRPTLLPAAQLRPTVLRPALRHPGLRPALLRPALLRPGLGHSGLRPALWWPALLRPALRHPGLRPALLRPTVGYSALLPGLGHPGLRPALGHPGLRPALGHPALWPAVGHSGLRRSLGASVCAALGRAARVALVRSTRRHPRGLRMTRARAQEQSARVGALRDGAGQSSQDPLGPSSPGHDPRSGPGPASV
ncbi:hypothetical protein [Cryptosporangium sp. NPDC051539]|uniref:hypothetical protein n=1 Tax=Cryptosporangium sp. NPDC051539 TaxID=3363962 RepID=UPI003796809F